MPTHYSIETCDHLGSGAEGIASCVVGPVPDVMHHIVIDGVRWRVLTVEHRVLNNNGVAETKVVIGVERDV